MHRPRAGDRPVAPILGWYPRDTGELERPAFFVLASRRMAVTAAELLVLVRAEGVEQTAAALAGLSASADGAALGLGALAIAGAVTVGAR